MKKLLATVLALMLVLGLTACGGGGGSSDGEVSVFYYTFSDTYVSTVRKSMDKMLKDAGIKFQNYDANNNQTTQTEQITTAIAKNSKLLIVNVVDTGSDDAVKNIVNMAKEKNIPLIFFNRSVKEEIVTSYDKCAFVGTDYEEAGHKEGKLVGEYVLANFDKLDLNKDGKISYVMFKGQEGNLEAIARTQYGVEDADKVLTAGGKAKLEFYDAANSKKYLVDQGGAWSTAAANDYMTTILSQYSVANKNMVELVIANNDEMALGAISALQTAGYNKEGGTVIPVFGVDAIDAAKEAINNGSMTGSIKQDNEGMASAITTITQNMLGGKGNLDDIKVGNVVGTWRVDIPYGVYTAEGK